MPKLRAAEVESGVDLAVYYDSAADSCAESDYYDVPIALAGAGEYFAECRCVGVVLDIDFLAQACADQRAQVGVAESQVAGIQHHAGISGGGAGGADTDGVQLVDGHLGFVERFPYCFGDGIRDLLGRAWEVGLAGRLCNDVVVLVNKTYLDVCSSEVDTYIVLHGFIPSCNVINSESEIPNYELRIKY